MKKIFVLLIVSIMFLGIVSAENPCGNTDSFLGIFKQGNNVALSQTCDSCTFVNLSSAKFPNGTIKNYNTAMTKNGVQYNSTFNDTSVPGCYTYTVVGDKSGVNAVESVDFLLNGYGFEFTTANSIFYIALLGLLAFLFILNAILISKLPSGNSRADSGNILSISILKYFKPTLMVVGYGLIIGIIFISSSISKAYLGDTSFSTYLFKLFKLATIFIYPAIILGLIWVIINIIRDIKIKQMLDRGFNPQ